MKTKPPRTKRVAKKASAAPAEFPGEVGETPSLLEQLFMPYQLNYLRDKSRFKIWEKSRRIGGTYAQSFEDVSECISRPGQKVFFSSADLTAASEYGDYIDDWTRRLNQSASALAQLDEHEATKLGDMAFADEEKDLRLYLKEFKNGSRIYLLSSNPKAFRSKGGKIVWDEAAWHDHAAKMWAAANPAAMWGHDLRILSTHNGPNSVFNDLLLRAKKGISGWKAHTTTIVDAAHQGLVARILRKSVTTEEIEEWIAQQRALCRTEGEWLQEYMCQPQDESTALLTYAAISSQSRDGLLRELSSCQGPLWVGFDVARKRHFSVIYVLEGGDPALTVRRIVLMERRPFSQQRDVLWPILELPQVQRVCIDATGIGAQIAEEALERFGSYKVEPIQFSGRVNESLALGLVREFDDSTLWIPGDLSGVDREHQLEGLHSVRKTTTVAGNARYDAAATEHGHGDHFWALALAVHAARTGCTGSARVESAPFSSQVPGLSGSFGNALNRFSRL